MTYHSSLQNNRPNLFNPRISRNSNYDTVNDTFLSNIDFSSLSETALDVSGSFKYDLANTGLKSSQQLNVDWTNFANHTFFNSAVVNVNVAFDKIINGFPFDGNKKELEMWMDSLSGFEKHVYDQFPKYKGYMIFSGTQPGEDVNGTKGTFIRVNDKAGLLYSELARSASAEPVLDFGSGSVSYEFQLYLPEIPNAEQIVFQKIGGGNGVSFVLTPTGSTGLCELVFAVSSGSLGMIATGEVTKGRFNHICAILDRSNSPVVELFINETLAGSSTDDVPNLGGSIQMGSLGPSFRAAPLVIGSGSSISLISYTPVQTLSGSIDEFRVFNEVRTINEQKAFANKSIYAKESLKLYYKFNEPLGGITDVVLDSSGNSLDASINQAGMTLGVRSIPTGSVATPMTMERLAYSPVLFPNHPDHQTFHDSLILSATAYDQINPNLITKLIPSHYLANGQIFEGLEEVEGEIGGDYAYTAPLPRSGQLGGTQLLLSLLYTYAKFFDELKITIDSFGKLMHVNYDSKNSVPNSFLHFLAKQYGFELPPIFNDATIEQYIEGENLRNDVSTDEYSLQYVQNQIWRRILTNIQDIIQSKGTLHSIKSFIRAVGIDPDANFRIREYGGPTQGSLKESRELKTEVTSLLAIDSSAFITSPYLYAPRVEPGYPEIRGTFVSGVSDTLDDWQITSGSWTVEALYKFGKYDSVTNILPASQSVAQIRTTGSAGEGLVLNVIANTYPDAKLKLYATPVADSTQTLVMTLDNVDVFDGKAWNISFGRERFDSIGSIASSSYFLRCAKQEGGELTESHLTSSYFLDGASQDIFASFQNSYNVSGSVLVIGNKSATSRGTGFLLNNTTIAPVEARVSTLEARVGHIKFWSKALSPIEWKEHVLNFKSLGVTDPSLNFNFETVATGSFERLRMDVSTDQVVTSSNGSGIISLTDFSQNNFTMTGYGFGVNEQVIYPERVSFSYLSPKFDECSTTNKVRIRGFQNYENVVNEGSHSAVGPVYDIPPSESPTDNTRFTLDFSIIDALDQDIIKMFATFDALDNIIGSPELLFSPDYPKLEVLRNLYFNRLTSHINVRSFFEFFKWFDTSMGSFIEQLLPRKTKFFGTNFVLHSCVLERPKYEYLYADNYVGENNRVGLKTQLLLQQIVGKLNRY
jgi:hypothetical protein